MVSEYYDQIGFTGTRRGMTDRQKEQLWGLVRHRRFFFHHGACAGADEDAHSIVGAAYWCYGRVAHPASDVSPQWQAIDRLVIEPRDIVLPPRAALKRSKIIVEKSEYIIATPYEDRPTQRSGTWATLRIAWRLKKPWSVILPNGAIIEGVGPAWGQTV